MCVRNDQIFLGWLREEGLAYFLGIIWEISFCLEGPCWVLEPRDGIWVWQMSLSLHYFHAQPVACPVSEAPTVLHEEIYWVALWANRDLESEWRHNGARILWDEGTDTWKDVWAWAIPASLHHTPGVPRVPLWIWSTIFPLSRRQGASSYTDAIFRRSSEKVRKAKRLSIYLREA